MSYADDVFKENLRDIIGNGSNTQGKGNRARWANGMEAWTFQKFGICNTYDLQDEFPLLTLRETKLKLAFDELLWIYQKKSNNIHDLNSKIWNQWADDSGSIGKAYGYQVGKLYTHVKKSMMKDPEQNIHDSLVYDINFRKLGYPTHTEVIKEIKEVKAELSTYCSNKFKVQEWKEAPFSTGSLKVTKGYKIMLDQMDGVLYDLKNNPFSRRIMISLWNVKDLPDMNLQPCCWSIDFMVEDRGYDKLVLNMVLNQRSADMITANNWNVCQYSLLLMMVAQSCNMIPGKLMHCICNAHIYDEHIEIAQELLNRKPAYKELPKIYLNPDKTNFYDFTVDDLIIEGEYIHGKNMKIPVAI